MYEFKQLWIESLLLLKSILTELVNCVELIFQHYCGGYLRFESEKKNDKK